MIKTTPHILLLEPYYGGSHKSFLKGMQKYVPFDFTLITLPARKWKMRMQLSAPWLAEKVVEQVESGTRFDGILCSTFVDVALLKTLLCKKNILLPIFVYFHENQFAYPNQLQDKSMYQFTALNFTTALAADKIAFNSKYNFDTFISGVEGYLKKAADMDVMHMVAQIKAKSRVLYPGVDFNAFNQDVSCESEKTSCSPVIIWNHRWEHDKDPETFFEVLFEFAKQNVDFKLIVLGQSFARQPSIFSEAREQLDKHIIHFGYVKDRQEYLRLLSCGDVVVSTARHEFYGIAVLEGVRSGCLPIVPDRLAYCELFPEKYRYTDGRLGPFLKRTLSNFRSLTKKESMEMTEKHSWKNLAGQYQQWMASFE